ncbi:cytochrome c-type biogenesis protein [Marinobacter halotolerans]|uniref:cytochrome c-type biogenesis protein n=1 Tax=Marinobacter halotolerans TaxID=1569211 RepID=UPI00124654E3|nr:cytochrome c-type biogenesis protein [Marinobacter halotolerans]
MMPTVRACLMMVLVLSSAMAAAQSRDVYQFDTERMEQRFQTLTAELRCPKCQNQNIADSNAPISEDMRNEVYRMMRNGASDREITEALVARFGEFVRYKPEVNQRTILLWVSPALMVTIGLLVVVFTVRRSGRKTANDDVLTDEERARAARLLNDRDENGSSS